MYKPYFAWEHRNSPKPKSGSKATIFAGNKWDDSAAPSMLLSDSDDEVSINDVYEQKPLHEQYEDDELETGNDSKRQVRFGDACIREHPVIMDGHTACCDVWPLSLDWTYRDEKVYNINDYEIMRQQSGRRQRGRLSKLAAEERRRILEQAGMDISQHQRQRNETVSTAAAKSLDRRKDLEPFPSFDPVDVQDVNQYDTHIEVLDEQPAMCNAFSVLQDAGWCMCAFGGELPTMKVEILED